MVSSGIGPARGDFAGGGKRYRGATAHAVGRFSPGLGRGAGMLRRGVVWTSRSLESATAKMGVGSADRALPLLGGGGQSSPYSLSGRGDFPQSGAARRGVEWRGLSRFGGFLRRRDFDPGLLRPGGRAIGSRVCASVGIPPPGVSTKRRRCSGSAAKPPGPCGGPPSFDRGATGPKCGNGARNTRRRLSFASSRAVAGGHRLARGGPKPITRGVGSVRSPMGCSRTRVGRP